MKAMEKNEIKRRNRIRREVALEQLNDRGPQHGRASYIPSAKEKANNPRRQRRNRDWLHY